MTCLDTRPYPVFLHSLAPPVSSSISHLLPPARCLLTSHQHPNVEKLLQTELRMGVQMPAWREEAVGSVGLRAALQQQQQSLPGLARAHGEWPTLLGSASEGRCWQGYWGTWGHRECKGMKQGSNRKQKERIAGGVLSKVAESRLVQFPMPYSVQNIPERHP